LKLFSPLVRTKLTEWFWRYLPLEILGTVTALAGAGFASVFTASSVIIAFAGTWGENVGYYAYATGRDWKAHFAEEPVTTGGVLRLVRNMLVEFGFAEVMDSFVVRPACMYLGQELLGSMAWGVVAGKLAADAVFYGFVIFFYELRKKLWG
jgi:hypothetical protein